MMEAAALPASPSAISSSCLRRRLASRLKWSPPRYQDIRGGAVTLLSSPDGGARLRLPWQADFNALVDVLAGSGSVGVERRPVRMGQLAVYGPG
jgi:quercetin 2,3-dioxygenase